MAYEVKEKGGSMFPNDKKGNDKAPDMTGNVKIDGKIWNVAGWKTKSKQGKAYLSLKVSEPQDSNGSQAQTSDDDLPF